MNDWLLFWVPTYLAAWLLTPIVHAQAGLRVGGNLAGFTTSTNNGYHTSTTNHLSYQASLYYKQPLTQCLSLVPEIQYSDERMTINRSFDYDPSFRAVYLSHFAYVNVPLMLRLTWGRVYAEVGPQAGVLVGGHETGMIFINQVTLHINRDVVGSTVSYRRFDVGSSLGVGVRLPGRVGLNLRAYQGLVSLTHDSGANLAHLYRQSLQGSLTYQLFAYP